MSLSILELERIVEEHRSWLSNPRKGRRAELRGADLTGINLADRCLRSADLTGATVREGKFSRVDLSHAVLVDADLSGAHLLHCNLEAADFSGACLHDAEIDSIILAKGNRLITSGGDYVTFRNADLSGAKIRMSPRYADFESANLRGADLCDSVFVGACRDAIRFNGAIFERTEFSRAMFAFVDFGEILGDNVPVNEA